MEAEIQQLWEEYLEQGFRPDQAEKKVYSDAKERGYPLAKVFLQLRTLRHPKRVVTYAKASNVANAFLGCQKDDDGKVVDPFTLQEIPEEFLLSYEENEQRYCFDLRSVAKAIYKEQDFNPLTRQPFPKVILEKGKQYLQKITQTVQVGETSITIIFDSVFDVLLKVLRVTDYCLFEALPKVNPFYAGTSLYALNFDDQFIIQATESIHLYPFQDLVEQAVSLKSLFEYSNRNRQEGGVVETLFHELGFLLRVPPTFLDPDGRQFMLDPNDTVYATIRKVYLWLGGLEMVQRYRLVLEDGTPLSDLKLKKKVCEEIPSLEIRYVYYDEEVDFQEAKDELFKVAFEEDDTPFIRALAKYPEELLGSGQGWKEWNVTLADQNYTMEELIEFSLKVFSEKEYFDFPFEKLHPDSLNKYLRGLILRCKGVQQLQNVLTILDIDHKGKWQRVVHFREINSDLQPTYIQALISNKLNIGEIKRLLEGERIDLNGQEESILVLLDDVEIFYRYYQHDASLLANYIFAAPSIAEYLLKHEPALLLYGLIVRKTYPIPSRVEIIIEKLSGDDLRVIFERVLKGERVFYINAIFASQKFPQDILDNEEYYTNPKVNKYLMQNKRFTKYAEMALANRNNSAVLKSLFANHYDLDQLVDVYAQTGLTEAYLAIAKRINEKQLQLLLTKLYIEPSRGNFLFFEQQSPKARRMFYITSGISKETVLSILCEGIKMDQYLYQELAEYFIDLSHTRADRSQFTDQDAQQLLVCQPNYAQEIASTGLHSAAIFKPYLSRLDKKELRLTFSMKTHSRRKQGGEQAEKIKQLLNLL